GQFFLRALQVLLHPLRLLHELGDVAAHGGSLVEGSDGIRDHGGAVPFDQMAHVGIGQERLLGRGLAGIALALLARVQR
ncbi:hypothetical protein ABTO37_19915, partial [Acinetobacter baumannii]